MMRFFIRILYLDGTGKEISYWSNFNSRKAMLSRFDELGISTGKVLQLMMRMSNESEYKEYVPSILLEEEGREWSK